jgi:hypothetical protein
MSQEKKKERERKEEHAVGKQIYHFGILKYSENSKILFN